MKITMCLLACFFLLGGCKKDQEKPKIKAHCTMNGYGNGKCSFTNKGGAGSQCIKVTVFKVSNTNQNLKSSTICSGNVGTRETKSKDFSIPGVNDLCSESGTPWTKVCAFSVKNDD